MAKTCNFEGKSGINLKFKFSFKQRLNPEDTCTCCFLLGPPSILKWTDVRIQESHSGQKWTLITLPHRSLHPHCTYTIKDYHLLWVWFPPKAWRGCVLDTTLYQAWGISFTGLTLPHLCACLKTGTWFPMPYVMGFFFFFFCFNGLRLEVKVKYIN